MELVDFPGCCGAKVLWDFRHYNDDEDYDEAQILSVLDIELETISGEIIGKYQDIKAFTAITADGQTYAKNLLIKYNFFPVVSWVNPGTKNILTLWFRRPNLTEL